MGLTGVHRVDLVVSSIGRSLPFYRGCSSRWATRASPRCEESAARPSGTWAERASRWGFGRQTPSGYDRYRIGVHHVAFEVPLRDVVDERHRWLLQHGAEIESPPREYDYLPGYSAVFFYDPDGIKLEIVHVPGRPQTAAELAALGR